METIATKVKNVALFINDGRASVRLTLADSIKGIKVINDEYVETDVNTITVGYYNLTEAFSGDLAYLYKKRFEEYAAAKTAYAAKLAASGDEEGAELLLSKPNTPFSIADLSYYLTNANIAIERDRFVPGDTYSRWDSKANDYVDAVRENIGYTTNILAIDVADTVKSVIAPIVASMLTSTDFVF